MNEKPPVSPGTLRRNIAVSTVSNVYVVLLNLAMTPVYIDWMGIETYGLIGFNAMLVGWFALLDLGLSHSFSRQVARCHGGAVSALHLRQLLRALEFIFITVAVAGSLGLGLCSGPIASGWLQAQSIAHDELARCVILMAGIIGVRWVTGLYRAMIVGSERLGWLGWTSMAIATLRSVGVVGLFAVWNHQPTTFFAWQLASAIAELILLTGMAYRLLPRMHGPIPWSWQPLRDVLGISLSFALLIGIWAVVNNLDKLLLSALLPLHEYAAFTAAVVAAGGVSLIAAPVGTAVQPRLTRLEAEGDSAGLVRLYRGATQVISAIALATAMVLVFHAEGVLWAWTGDRTLAAQAAPVLTLYALGNGVVAVVSAAYFLQYAKGELRLHLIGNVAMVGVLIPAIILSTRQWGPVGAGWTWLLSNVAYLIFWVPVIHRRFVPGLHLRWLAVDILPMALATAATACAAWMLLPLAESRLGEGLAIVVVAIVTLIAGAAASPVLRQQLRLKAASRRPADQGDR